MSVNLEGLYEEMEEAVGEDNLPAFEAFIQCNFGPRDELDIQTWAANFEECYEGEYEDRLSFACELLNSMYGTDETLEKRYPELTTFFRYFDYDKFTNDLFMGDYYSISTGNGTVWIFRRD